MSVSAVYCQNGTATVTSVNSTAIAFARPNNLLTIDCFSTAIAFAKNAFLRVQQPDKLGLYKVSFLCKIHPIKHIYHRF